MSCVYLSLGSNLGDSLGYLQAGVTQLSALPDTKVMAVSAVYRTAAWGKTDQPDFLNICVRLETQLAPVALLEACQAIELAQNRERKLHWGPRTLDIDLLLYDDLTLALPRLTLPHPYLWQRAFVLLPLLDVVCPPYETEVQQTLAILGTEGVSLTDFVIQV